MKLFFQRIILWVYLKIHFLLVNVGIILARSEEEVFGMPSELDGKYKIVQRKLHRNPILNKFYAGQRDEKFVQDYYELLEKAEKFMRTATPRQMAVAADKHGLNYGMKDHYGRRYEHYGFFDGKHKHAGKTMGEVLLLEKEERRTKDDDYELLEIYNNHPIEQGLAGVMDILEKNDKNSEYEYQVVDVFKKSKQFVFPIYATHENENIVNKIEQLADSLHVKKIGMEYRQLEFFIPLKFKTSEIADGSKIFKELIDVKEIFIRNEFGKSIAFAVENFHKRITYNNTHEVWKFQGIEMENVIIVR